MNIIEVDQLTNIYGGRSAVSSASFSVKKGHIHGLLGPNGAGKTTTMQAIAGIINPTSGQVKFSDHMGDTSSSEFYSKIGTLIEEAPLYDDMDVSSYLTYVALLKKVPKENVGQYLDDCLKVLGLESVAKRLIGNLSKGYKQRVGIGQAIINKPELIILDEPTVGLDPQSVVEIRNLILDLKGAHTILISSHLLHEMSLVCDDITIISDGVILESGNLSHIKEKLSNTSTLLIKLQNNPEHLKADLLNIPGVQFVESAGHDLTVGISSDSDIRHLISNIIFENNLGLLEFVQKEKTLEEIFVTITDRGQL